MAGAKLFLHHLVFPFGFALFINSHSAIFLSPQNFLRCQNNKNNYNLVCETLQFLDCICGSTTGGLGLLGLYINEKNVALINQTLESLTEYCQGPCHENQVHKETRERAGTVIWHFLIHFFFFVSLQNCIATHESNGIDIIIALILNDINPLGKKRMDLVLELKVSEVEEGSMSLCETGEWVNSGFGSWDKNEGKNCAVTKFCLVEWNITNRGQA